MSQNISVIGSHSPVTDDSTGLHVQEHSAEKIAQEALSDAPPLMTDEMDKAREMTRVPDRDLSESLYGTDGKHAGTGQALRDRFRHGRKRLRGS